MTAAASSFASASVLVVGDVIFDRYWSGPVTRISPEAPVPVVRITASEDRPGGAANVAMNVASLGAKATLIGVTGTDEAATRIAEMLEGRGVRCGLTPVPGFTTVTKLRVLSQHQQLIRLDFEEIDASVRPEQLLRDFRAHLADVATVILSDYAKGCLQDVEALIQTARTSGKPVIVDPKGRDFARYRGATVVTPNLKELQQVVGPCGGEAEIVERARGLCAEFDLDALLVTRGEQGMTLVPARSAAVHLATEAREVYDVTGAGDTVVAVLGAAIAAGYDLEHATALANTAAGIVVGRLGAASVTAAELGAARHPPPTSPGSAVTEEELLVLMAAARARGERIVMTNGCFDVVHAGHVHYLEEARRLGDRLIVAVNDDGSVARLKGLGRPLHPLAQRTAVLAALRAVDWVVSFGEDTPRRLICRVAPDVLVKGGDYAPQAIAGADCVRARGGRVVVLGYVAGCSTSRILAELAHPPLPA